MGALAFDLCVPERRAHAGTDQHPIARLEFVEHVGDAQVEAEHAIVMACSVNSSGALGNTSKPIGLYGESMPHANKRPIEHILAPSLAALLVLFAPPIRASDHLDGPASSDDSVVDLTDLFAFPTPETPGSLTIILDVYPVVSPSGHFSDAVSYTIYVRRAAIRPGDAPGFDTSDEVAIRCTFVSPRDHADHLATCKTDRGIGATVKVGEVLPRGSDDGFHLFAGQRSDPFFFNAVFASAFSVEGKLVAPRDQDIIAGTNVLSVVIDVDVDELFPSDSPSLLALAAETITQDSESDPVRRLDRLGRPEITNVTLVAHDDEPVLHDQYNADRPFEVAADHASVYRERIAKNLVFFDAIDGHTDWTDTNRLALTELLVDDFLVVDLARPCDQPAFFEIERSLLEHEPHRTCGGRRPTDDIMDVLFGLYAGGLDGPPVVDGVDHPSQPISDQFPYLAGPDTSPQSGLKTMVLGSSGCGCHGTKGKGGTGGGAALVVMVMGLGLRKRRRNSSAPRP